MLSSVRSLAGLGNPPEYYTTNANESLNHLLKRKVDFKRSEWPQFNEILFTAVKEQQEEFAKAVFSQGQYEIRSEYKHLQVSHLKWIQMNSDQRQSKIEKAQRVKLRSEMQSMCDSGPSSSFQISRHMSIDVENAQISHVSREKVQSMWEKAEELLNGDGLVLPAAGATKTSRQVASLSAFKSGRSEAPHNVTSHQRKIGTEVKCDCPVYRSSPYICQHALATAEDLGILTEYLQWVRKTKKSLNLSQLVADQIPNNAGKKPSSNRKGPPKKKKQQQSVCDVDASSSLTPMSTLPPPADAQIESPTIPPNVHSLSDTYPTPSSNVYPPSDTYPTPSNTHPLPSNSYRPPSNSYRPQGSAYPGYVYPPLRSTYPHVPPPNIPYALPYNAFSPLCNPYFSVTPQQASSMDSNLFTSGSYQIPDATYFQDTPLPQMMSPSNAYTVAPVSQLTNSTQDSPVFTLQWLTGKIRKCYGCGNSLRTETNAVPKPPYDIVVRYKERRYYRDPDTQVLKLTKSEENTYYHPMLKCIHMKHPSFNKSQLYIPVDLANNLLPLHRSHIFDTFNIML